MNFYRNAVKGANEESAKKKFTIKDKLAYMCGDLGCNMSFALNSYLMLFWTQYMGLSLTTWGIIILLLVSYLMYLIVLYIEKVLIRNN